MKNYLSNQTSPYLLQHADNPVHWYPWCQEAFERAVREDKPIFLSIGYSTCHWCHVMAHESFEDEEIAEILNQYYIAIKVDKEERPDIDSVYMSVCQALTGSGGWPMSIFMTPDQRPFFAGTYFPKTTRFGNLGLKELLLTIQDKWEKERGTLLKAAYQVIQYLNQKGADAGKMEEYTGDKSMRLAEEGFEQYRHTFDSKNGGFGKAPKFPTPHNLLFLMRYYQKTGITEALEMAEKTLVQMYRGGIYDHIGGGFSRYSTDELFLVPHFEKMLYDNALLIMAYCKLYQLTRNSLYCGIAEETADYIIREMTSKEGGFYSAQDADSEGVEGKYYLFEAAEIIRVCTEEKGEEFNRCFDITQEGNFEGKNIPNRLKQEDLEKNFKDCRKKLYEYRKTRYQLHLDDKILTSWNGLMIAAMCHLYRVSGKEEYLDAAKKADRFLEEKLWDGSNLFVSSREGKRSRKGFLEDYANVVFARIALYEATYEGEYLKQAVRLSEKAIRDFYDAKQGGFFLYGKENEDLILRPKETYDGAVFSGNSAMAFNLVRLSRLTAGEQFERIAEEQLAFMMKEADQYPSAYSMFLIALLDHYEMQDKVTVVVKERTDIEELSIQVPLDVLVTILEKPSDAYPLLNDRTTYYICKGQSCLPPVNELKNQL